MIIDVREHNIQRDHFKNCNIFVTRRSGRREWRHAGCRASHVALDVTLSRWCVYSDALVCFALYHVYTYTTVKLRI